MYIVKNVLNLDQYEFDTIEEAIDCVWKKLSKEEQKEIADNYLVYPDNKEHYSFGEYMVDHWKKYFSDYIDLIEENNDQFVMGVPSYAVCYLIYGESEGLNDEDIENIDQWIVSMEKVRNGRHFDISPINGREEYFSNNPPFGLPCNVMDCWILYQ